LNAVIARNDPPQVFQRGGLLTRLRFSADDGAPHLEPLGDDALRGVLARVADWTKLVETRRGQRDEDDAPPMEVVKDLATLPEWRAIPLLEDVIETPVFSRTGELVVAPGYHP
jgi:hypothetical protein